MRSIAQTSQRFSPTKKPLHKRAASISIAFFCPRVVYLCQEREASSPTRRERIGASDVATVEPSPSPFALDASFLFMD